MPGAVELGSGYISLYVNTGGAGNEINRLFSGASRSAKHEGRQAGNNFKEGFRDGTRGLFDNVREITVFAAAVSTLARRGMPDLSFGVEGVTRKVTLMAGALTAAAGAAGPLLGMAGGLGLALAGAAGGAGAFALAVKPAFSQVFEATTTVTDAQNAYNAAIKAGDSDAAKKALEERKLALEALTPVQREATLATIGLVDEFKKQSLAFATPALEAYTRGVGTLKDLIPQLLKVAQPASDELINLFDRATAALASDEAEEFVDFLATQVGPAIHGIAQLAIDLGATVKNAFMVANPVMAATLEMLDDVFGSLREASAGEGLAQFFEDSAPVIGEVGELLKSVGGLLGSLFTAALPLAKPVLDLVTALVNTLERLFESDSFAGFVENIGGILESLMPIFDVLSTVLGQIFEALSGQLLEVMPVLVPAIIDFATALADVLVGLSPLLPSLIQLVAALVTGLLPALYPIITLIRVALIPVVDLLTEGVELLTPFIGDLVDRLRELAGSGDGIKARLLPVVGGVLTAFRDLWRVLGPILKQIGDTVRQAFIENLPEIREAGQELKSIFTGVIDLIQANVENLTRILGPFWEMFGPTIMAEIRNSFRTIISIIKNALRVISGVIKLFVALTKGDWSGAWDAIKQIVDGALGIITAIVRQKMERFQAIFNVVFRAVALLVQKRIDQVKTTLTVIRDWVMGRFAANWSNLRKVLVSPVELARAAISRLLTRIKNSFSTLKSNIRTIWDGVKAIVSDPVTWIKDKVYNGILVPVWNRVAKLVGGTELKTYKTGGIHDSLGVQPGYTPGRDTHIIGVGGGEAVMRPEWTRAAGKAYVDEANEVSRRYGVKGALAFIKARGLPLEGEHEHFAGGGIVGWARRKLSGGAEALAGLPGKLKDWTLGSLAAAAAAALRPIRRLIDDTLTGNLARTTLAKVGNKAIDMVLSKIENSDVSPMDGQGDPGGPPGTGSRKRVTWKGGVFTERFRNTLVRAQELAGVGIPVIQGGFSRRVAISGTSHYGDAIDTRWDPRILRGLRGARVASWHRTPQQGFAHHIHGVPLPGAGYPGGSGVWQAQDYLRGGNGLAAGGIVTNRVLEHLAQQSGMRVRKFDTGGYLEPGATLALNHTGKRERIRTAEQEAALSEPLIGSLTLVSRNDKPGEDIDEIAFKLRELRRSGVNHRGVK